MFLDVSFAKMLVKPVTQSNESQEVIWKALGLRRVRLGLSGSKHVRIWTAHQYHHC